MPTKEFPDPPGSSPPGPPMPLVSQQENESTSNSLRQIWTPQGTDGQGGTIYEIEGIRTIIVQPNGDFEVHDHSK